MYRLKTTRRFEKGLKLCEKRGLNLEKLSSVVKVLQRGETLAPRYKLHKLVGEFAGFWECHIEPDWLLIFDYDEDTLILVQTGTHSDLFD